eukprot:12908018-Prorocentrum_lima.AAC.1
MRWATWPHPAGVLARSSPVQPALVKGSGAVKGRFLGSARSHSTPTEWSNPPPRSTGAGSG